MKRITEKDLNELHKVLNFMKSKGGFNDVTVAEGLLGAFFKGYVKGYNEARRKKCQVSEKK